MTAELASHMIGRAAPRHHSRLAANRKAAPAIYLPTRLTSGISSLPDPRSPARVPGVTATGQEVDGEALASGFIAFNPSALPSVMEVGQRPESLEVRIVRAMTLTDRVEGTLIAGLPAAPVAQPPADQVAAGPLPATVPHVQPIQVSAAMILTLSGTDFRIERDTCCAEKQAVTESGSTWKWNIVPLRSGRTGLSLCVAVEINTPEGFQPSTNSCPWEPKVRVTVNPFTSLKQSLSPNLPWLGPILIPFVAAGGKEWFKRLEKEGSGFFYLLLLAIDGLLFVLSKAAGLLALPMSVVSVSVVGAFQLRKDAALANRGFVSLMGMALRQVPLALGKRRPPSPQSAPGRDPGQDAPGSPEVASDALQSDVRQGLSNDEVG